MTLINDIKDKVKFLSDKQKKLLCDPQITIFYDQYKLRHHYFSLKGISYDFINEILGINPKCNKNAIDEVMRAVRYRFIQHVKKDPDLEKISGYSYKIKGDKN